MTLRRFLGASILSCGIFTTAMAIDPSNFDTTVSPKDDFYQYANGTWLKNHPIPPAYTSWGSFEEVNDQVETILREIMDRATTGKPADPLEQKVGDFYASGLDLEAIEKAGLHPLEEKFQEIAALKSNDELAKLTADFHARGVTAMFSFASGQDEKDSRQVIAVASQGGLSLPDRDYYIRDDAESVKLRDLFREHVARAFVLLGDDPKIAKGEAASLLNIETLMARASKSAVDLRDPAANYHKLSLDELKKITPHFAWDQYLAQAGVVITSLDVTQPEYLQALDGLISKTSVDEWKIYYRYHILDDSASYLAKAYDDEFFAFYGKALSGALEHHERWKRVLGTVSGSIDQIVGQLFVRNNFPAESKQRMLVMIENLRSSLRERIKLVTWMDEPTRKAALIKLDRLGVKVGYPDKWINYDSLHLDRSSYAENVFRSEVFNVHRDLAKIGHPVDRAEWDMSPQTINAYYSQNLNEIVFPAAILRPPFFDPKASDPEIYGAIGAVIGHEMTHGFDDNGRQYDGDGNLRDWWTPESTTHFKERSQAIVKQFNSYVVLNGLHVNGELTQGENIADLGGLRIAFAALEKTRAFKQKPAQSAFSPAQLFFLSYATVWRDNTRPETMRVYVNTDPHSPPNFRVNGPLSNLPAFFQAFDIPNVSPMHRVDADRVEIW